MLLSSTGSAEIAKTESETGPTGLCNKDSSSEYTDKQPMLLCTLSACTVCMGVLLSVCSNEAKLKVLMKQMKQMKQSLKLKVGIVGTCA